MYDARTILSRHIVARDDTESLVFLHHHLVVFQRTRLHPRHQLLVVQPHEVSSLAAPEDFEWLLIAFLVLFSLEVGGQTAFCQNVDSLFTAIRVLALHRHVVNLGTYAESGVRWECPRGGCPCEDVGGEGGFGETESGKLGGALEVELCSHCCVLHIAVATGLVQFVAGKSRSGSRRVGLDGVALIEQALVVELLQQIPEAFDILVVVGDVGVLKVHPVAHLLREFCPLAGVHHHVLAASIVVVVHTDFLADVFLRDAERLLHTQFHRQSVRVPTSLALHLETLHRLIAEECVLYRASHHVVNAWVSVG